MEEEILTQDMEEEDDIETEMKLIEKEEAAAKTKKPTVTKTAKENEQAPVAETNETYEAFAQPARLTIVNTINGEAMDFQSGRDEAIVQLGVVLLNKLEKIEIASGI